MVTTPGQTEKIDDVRVLKKRRMQKCMKLSKDALKSPAILWGRWVAGSPFGWKVTLAALYTTCRGRSGILTGFSTIQPPISVRSTVSVGPGGRA